MQYAYFTLSLSLNFDDGQANPVALDTLNQANYESERERDGSREWKRKVKIFREAVKERVEKKWLRWLEWTLHPFLSWFNELRSPPCNISSHLLFLFSSVLILFFFFSLSLSPFSERVKLAEQLLKVRVKEDTEMARKREEEKEEEGDHHDEWKKERWFNDVDIFACWCNE